MARDGRKVENALLGGGCFWCVESVFRHVEGVLKVTSGYAGGSIPNPTYEQVCRGTTGHVEVVEILFDPETITYAELLRIFFATHDPTTRDRQGNDVGSQYRSVIYFNDEEQRRVAHEVKAELEREKTFNAPIVTVIAPAEHFFEAEEYHQDYFNRNPEQPYCVFSIPPKLEKLKKYFPARVSGNLAGK